ncbi:hypothetical protein A1Q1_04431 [Trichosporon asahii var. asahii CBS 2479]|uniref:SH3 domain-containing protein n=1 Tax=Trichosporon asahii var. asahii (strain ATCC 90039 / CBS 2479 / JCM 2466 / KCTC 7840 / NBRC 103889/ NCYC 2677 / UAMH 7654) TaxID=1186058 RepID=J4U8K5_TRIAS|nr:hypothetical protein A1Q1_04431 [Trichosporon asahii var. asahii CBS 2479]EJT46830.1 hypothetical protein A1Q1_04431 [Trichosporon asahii var. asahii CBS 2479]
MGLNTPLPGWSPPSAIGVGGFGFGGQAGAEMTDFLIVLNSRSALASFMSAGSLTLGGNLSVSIASSFDAVASLSSFSLRNLRRGRDNPKRNRVVAEFHVTDPSQVAVGPLGRNAEGSGSVNTKGNLAAMYSYSKTKGLFGGVSVEGTVLGERKDANKAAYGGEPTAKQILTGSFDPPNWAYTLIDELNRCTGMPGGQTWIDDSRYAQNFDGRRNSYDYDDSDFKGAEEQDENPYRSGYSTPPAGYAFGEGVGAGGNTSRKRASSLFSIGGKDKGSAAPMFASRSTHEPAERSGNSTPPEQRNAPSRPWERRSSAYLPNLPHLPGTRKGDYDRRPGPSSETYNAEVSRSSSVKRPYEKKATPSPFSDAFATNGTSRSSTPPSDSWDAAGAGPKGPNASWSTGSKDLLGSWDADEQGLTQNFGRMGIRRNTGTPPRSRSSSQARPFDDIAEDPYAINRPSPPRTPSRGGMSPSRSGTGIAAALTRKLTGRKRASTLQTPWERTRAPKEWDSPLDEYPEPTWRGEHHTLTRERSASLGNPLGHAGSSAYNNRNSMYGAPPRGNINPLAHERDSEAGYPRAVALFDYASTESEDLPLRKGQIITLLEGVDAQWWKGRCDGKEGIFPNNHVEVLDIPKVLKCKDLTRSQLRSRVLGLNDFD